VGGTLTGLAPGNAIVLVMDVNDALEHLTRFADGPFTFTSRLTNDLGYMVDVSQQPPGQTCTVTNSSGPIADANVTNVIVTCTTLP
jgi:hypothetical protein